jgi:hypothetical protein
LEQTTGEKTMNPTEQVALDYLSSIGYNREKITHLSNKSPDFICPDGSRYEVKLLYGNRLVFYEKQITQLQSDDTVLVFNQKILVKTFKWGERKKLNLTISIQPGMVGYKTIVISAELHERLTKLKIHPRQSYEEVIKGLLKKRK